jgi:hypothetical protein
MSSLTISLISTVCIFGGVLLGRRLQTLLPADHLTKETHEIMKLGFGIIGTLTALVLGLLVSTAKSSFDAVNSGLILTSSKIIMLDRVLAQYGTETKPIRDELYQAVEAAIQSVWGRQGVEPTSAETLERGKMVEAIQQHLQLLTTQNDVQRRLRDQAIQLANEFAQSRWLLVEEVQVGLPVPFLALLIFWVTILFTSFGLFAPRNATVMVALLMCAVSVSAAIFLVLELSRPLTGMVRISVAPLRNALEHIDK